MPPLPHPPAGVDLAEVMSAAVARWRLQSPRWSSLQWSPEADCVPPIELDPARLEQALCRRLCRIEASARRLRRPDRITLRCWSASTAVLLELLTLEPYQGRRRWQWRFRRQPQLGAAPRHPRRGRTILPAEPPPLPRPADELGRGVPVCLVGRDPALAESMRLLLRRLDYRTLWTTASLRLARQWLAHHPNCPLVAIEATHDGQAQLWLTRPPCMLGPGSPRLNIPFNFSDLLTAARKICSLAPGNSI